MATSSTVIAALKFRGGVVIASDSQASDLLVSVRWPVEKVARVGQHPLVIGFSGSMGMGQRARTSLDGEDIRPTTFNKPTTVQAALDRALAPVYKAIQENARPPQPHPLLQVGLTALAVYWAGKESHILEREINGDSCFHDYFHAIGSGSQTAYAVYRTLGGKRLSELDEARALMALLRIVRTAVSVDLQYVSEPLSAFVISGAVVRQLSPDELQTHLQAVSEWEREECERFFTCRLYAATLDDLNTAE